MTGSRTLTFVNGCGRLNPDFLPRFIAEMAEDALVAVICHTGKPNDAPARELAAQGYTRFATYKVASPAE